MSPRSGCCGIVTPIRKTSAMRSGSRSRSFSGCAKNCETGAGNETRTRDPDPGKTTGQGLQLARLNKHQRCELQCQGGHGMSVLLIARNSGQTAGLRLGSESQGPHRSLTSKVKLSSCRLRYPMIVPHPTGLAPCNSLMAPAAPDAPKEHPLDAGRVQDARALG